ncbi:hypothetical protein F5144DRAFT_199146 [Chaetomium tenue]|uniref:Uncharacterized protein n=1 Tax=Chaetomium tenue TaxID=1854479 RepID=A0ACB7PIM1_9PEZI|nr:hypothetical protein F5144DRAFT_199146 [Chaetomium globosum]
MEAGGGQGGEVHGRGPARASQGHVGDSRFLLLFDVKLFSRWCAVYCAVVPLECTNTQRQGSRISRLRGTARLRSSQIGRHGFLFSDFPLPPCAQPICSCVRVRAFMRCVCYRLAWLPWQSRIIVSHYQLSEKTYWLDGVDCQVRSGWEADNAGKSSAGRRCPIHFHSAQSWLPSRVRYPYHHLLTAYEPANQLPNQPASQPFTPPASQPRRRLCICHPVIADRGKPLHKQKQRAGWHCESIKKLRFCDMHG